MTDTLTASFIEATLRKLHNLFYFLGFGGKASHLVDCRDDQMNKLRSPPHSVLAMKGGHILVCYQCLIILTNVIKPSFVNVSESSFSRSLNDNFLTSVLI